MSAIIDHAKREFLAIGYSPIEQCENGPDKWVQENVIELLTVFESQGHSGFSAAYVIAYFEKLAKFLPIAPLTGNDDEWCEVRYGVFQNKRCGAVFKDANQFNGQAYYLDGIVWKDKDGVCFTNSKSRVLITFPYIPKTEYKDAED